MGALHMYDWASEEFCSKKQGLIAHIQSNFYPPHPQYVQESMISGFERYWNDEIGLDELTEACYLKDIYGLYKYFGPFLKERDQ